MCVRSPRAGKAHRHRRPSHAGSHEAAELEQLEDMGTWRGWADEEPDEQQLTDESLALGSPSNTASTSTGGADEAGSEDSELEGVLAQTVALSRLRRQMSEDSGMADLAPEVQDEIAQLSSDLGRSLSPQQAQVLDAEILPLLGM